MAPILIYKAFGNNIFGKAPIHISLYYLLLCGLILFSLSFFQVFLFSFPSFSLALLLYLELSSFLIFLHCHFTLIIIFSLLFGHMSVRNLSLQIVDSLAFVLCRFLIFLVHWNIIIILTNILKLIINIQSVWRKINEAMS